ncbi:MAG TPA: monovalent cation/H+ antiporter subunit D [Paracoccus solventivorans]|uniref:monovalent cation/H+ antiporter subunit D n=1 Tax=Paracoccus solventivorans TaxID=53463 RepID=UPI002CC42E30|nr:monovalent cation/H+ antiporter subunit D [Paracoccus solventivorans]HMM10352.1 monovalent cation/H+ antiporter subunit D [Paracoccus solventivorans]
MNHWLVVPVVLPAFAGPLIVLSMRHDLVLQRVFSTAATAAQLLLALWLLLQSMGGEIQVYRLGNWAAPFGIVLMLDRLAALMLVLAGVLGLVIQLYAIGSGWDRRGRHFHSLWQFQLMGINGAFLTGDAFNLFVLFEILLIASYGLMIHAGGELRLRAGVQYVVYNLLGSSLFLAALGTLYAVTGTLNMADMAARVAQMPPEDTALLRVGAVLLMLVFAVKAALVPLHFWLPATYARAPGPVAALFAIMTKVGIYGIIRFFTLVFPSEDALMRLAADILLPAALVTLIVGQLGVLGARHMGRMTAFAALGSVGTVMVAVAQFQPAGLAAGIWYLVHSTLATAALFLAADLIGTRRQGGSLWLRPAPPIAQAGIVAALYFAAAIAMAGLPPLSGFLGKLAVLQSVRGTDTTALIWAVVLVTSIFGIVGLTRAGSMVFWRAHEEGTPAPHPPEEPQPDAPGFPSAALALTSVGALVAAMVVLTVLAGPMMRLAQDTAAQLSDPQPYIEAVLERQEGVK